MAERKDKEPVFGKLDDLDTEAGLPSRLRGSGLRSDDHADQAGDPFVWAERAKGRNAGTQPPEPAISAASGLTTRTHPLDVEPEGSGPGHPGAAMRFAREKLGLDTAALGSMTRLSRRIIEDLEANRFDSMPPAYVRGYLRGVARELGGDAESWIRAYESLGYTEPVLRPTVQKNPSARWGLSGGVWSLTVAAILVSALGLGVYAWTEGDRETPFAGIAQWFDEMQQRFTPAGPEPVPETEPRPDTTAPSAQGPASAQGQPLTELEWVPEVSPQEPALGSLILEPLAERDTAPPAEPESAAPPAEEGLQALPQETRAEVDDAALPESAAALEPDSSPVPALPDPVPAPQPDPAVVEAPPVAAPEPVVPPVAVPAPAPADGRQAASAAEDRSTLSLSFESTSWVEVRSAADRVALQGIFHAGDERTVSLQLPARVVLGNAPGVRLMRDGATVDLVPHTRADRTARFSLGAD